MKTNKQTKETGYDENGDFDLCLKDKQDFEKEQAKKQGRKDKEAEMIKELSHFKTKCVDLMCEVDELKNKLETCRKDAIDDELKWLKEIQKQFKSLETIQFSNILFKREEEIDKITKEMK